MEWRTYVCDCDNCTLRGGCHLGLRFYIVVYSIAGFLYARDWDHILETLDLWFTKL